MRRTQTETNARWAARHRDKENLLNPTDAAEKFKVALESMGRSPHTVRNYGADAMYFAKWISSPRAAAATKGLHKDAVFSITFDDVMRFLRSYTANHSDSYANRMKSALSGFFGYLFDAGHIAKVPFRTLGHKKIVRRQPRRMTPAEVRRLYAAAEKRPLTWLLVNLYHGLGLRESEAIQLNMSDVVGREDVRIIGKRGRVRLLPVTEALKEAVEAWKPIHESILTKARKTARFDRRRRRRSGVDNDALILNAAGGRLTDRGVRMIMAQVFAVASLPKMTVHGLRHGCAQDLKEGKVQLQDIQDFLGHEDPKTTAIYAGATREDVRRAAEGHAKTLPRLGKVASRGEK